MEYLTKTFETVNGPVEGARIKWPGFALLFVTGTKGFLVCGAFDLEAINSFGGASAMVDSSPDNPIGTLDNFPNRVIKKVNEKAKGLGIIEGMDVSTAFELIA